MTPRLLLLLASTLPLAAALACGNEAVKEDEPIGRPPSEAERLAPRDTSIDDLRGPRRRVVGPAVTPQTAPASVAVAAPATAAPPATAVPPATAAPPASHAAAPPATTAAPPATTAAPPATTAAPPASVAIKPASAAVKPGGDLGDYATFDDIPRGTPSEHPHHFVGEDHLTNIRKLTEGGQNAEAYFSPNGKLLVFQSTRDGLACDQIFTMKVDGSGQAQASTGQGVTTCGYWLPDNRRILFSSTHAAAPECPPRPDFRKYGGYVWRVDPNYEIYTAQPGGKGLKPLTESPGYDAEATISPKGDRIVFTSNRDGDLELYSMKLDGSDVKRLTNTPGYDGGAFFDRTGKRIVFRAYHPKTPAELAEYQRLLKEDVVKPSVMEIYVMNADGTEAKQVTDLGAASFAPFFHPDGKRIIFSSNLHDPKGRDFDLYIVNIDGSGLERLTFNPTFDAFPMFSPNGKQLIFASNRSNAQEGETNVFIADWKD